MREKHQKRTLWTDRHTILFFNHHPRLAKTKIGKHALRFARAEIRWTTRELGETRVALRPHIPPPITNHLAMWLCIHGKEGAWDANTGNGYLGGLQMTPGWGGVSRPDLLSPGAQIALAESQYAASGYSIGWLRGQWPNTSWGCV